MSGLNALAIDDEAPALDELGFLLRHCPLVDRVEGAASAEDALRHLQREAFDVVVADIRMPGLDGLELARVLRHFAAPPEVVFVTAHEGYALEAFEVGAAGYLLKPLDAGRLAEVLTRVRAARSGGAAPDDLATLAVELPGRIRMVARNDVEWVEASGDYVRLHTVDGDSALVRIPIGLLEERWSEHGFARIHRGHLVALGAVRELRTDGTATYARVGTRDLPVSRRHVHDLRERLVRHAGHRRR
ncbi:MAG TPA: LytTR family DNA-binding domain-containing protein [Acidimicrobiales bacterium]|nr:LytTR family DNA-binding domain-containing protein [Acidimicrobiales bacterium]